MIAISDIQFQYPILYNNVDTIFKGMSTPVVTVDWVNYQIITAYTLLDAELLGDYLDRAASLYVAHELSRISFNSYSSSGNGLLASRKVDGEYTVTYDNFEAQSLSDYYQSEYGLKLQELLRKLTVPFMVSTP